VVVEEILINLVILQMPYYRIVIWTKHRSKPYTGIRLISEPNINTVFNMAHSKANELYRDKVIDVEVQMLSKLCSAVKMKEKKNPTSK
jgi:hypothetical protein